MKMMRNGETGELMTLNLILGMGGMLMVDMQLSFSTEESESNCGLRTCNWVGGRLLT